MINAGIFDSDILIVDRSIKALHNHTVIASLNGDFLCKRLHLTSDTPQLIAETPAYTPIILSGESELEIFGVVTYVIHSLTGP
jgi:DNA polymerase V